MKAHDWLLLVGAAATIAASWIAAKYAKRSSERVAQIGADEGAFMRAKEIYEGAIAQLEKERAEQRERFDRELASARTQFDHELSDARARFELERGEARAEDHDRIEKLERQVAALKARLASAGIDVSDLDLD